jgi:nucleoporin p58/p45
LFGANNNANIASAGGIFGANNNAGSNTVSTGGLFGTRPATTTSTTSGLFGGSAATNTNPSGSFFGAKPAAPTGGLFGSSSASTVPAAGLFGDNTVATGSLFGGQQQQVQQEAQLPNITPLTTIGDLPENFRREIEQLDQFIQNQVQIAEQLKAEKDEHSEVIKSIPRDIEYLQNKYSHINQALDNDLKLLQDIRASTDEALEDAENFFVILQRLLSVGSKTSSVEIDQYFNKKAKYYKEKLEKYIQALSEIDAAVQGLEKDSISDVGGMNLVITTVHEEFELFMEVANAVADVHHKMNHLKEQSNGKV